MVNIADHENLFDEINHSNFWDFVDYYFAESNSVKLDREQDHFTILKNFCEKYNLDKDAHQELTKQVKANSVIRVLDASGATIDHVLVLNRYMYPKNQEENILGQGSYGKVKLAYSRKYQALVALKVQKDVSGKHISQYTTKYDEVREEDNMILEFFKSIHGASAKLADKGKEIARKSKQGIKKAGYGFKIYSIMPLFTGGNIRDYLTKVARTAITHDDVLLTLIALRNVAIELGRFHAAGYIHADLKLENIMFNYGRNLKFDITKNPCLVSLVDFGMCLNIKTPKLISNYFTATKTDINGVTALRLTHSDGSPHIMGTPQYITSGKIPDEIFQKKNANDNVWQNFISGASKPGATYKFNEIGQGLYSFKSDIFALGRVYKNVFNNRELRNLLPQLVTPHLQKLISAMQNEDLTKRPTPQQIVDYIDNNIIDNYIIAHDDKLSDNAKSWVILKNEDLSADNNTTNETVQSQETSYSGSDDSTLSEVEIAEGKNNVATNIRPQWKAGVFKAKENQVNPANQAQPAPEKTNLEQKEINNNVLLELQAWHENLNKKTTDMSFSRKFYSKHIDKSKDKKIKIAAALIAKYRKDEYTFDGNQLNLTDELIAAGKKNGLGEKEIKKLLAEDNYCKGSEHISKAVDNLSDLKPLKHKK